MALQISVTNRENFYILAQIGSPKRGRKEVSVLCYIIHVLIYVFVFNKAYYPKLLHWVHHLSQNHSYTVLLLLLNSGARSNQSARDIHLPKRNCSGDIRMLFRAPFTYLCIKQLYVCFQVWSWRQTNKKCRIDMCPSDTNLILVLSSAIWSINSSLHHI